MAISVSGGPAPREALRLSSGLFRAGAHQYVQYGGGADMMRRSGIVLGISLLVGGVLSLGSYALMEVEQSEDEALFIEQHIERRVTSIDQSIRRSARQLDLLVAYYEASPEIDTHGMADFLQSIWTNFPDNRSYGALPIAMGWIDISRAPEDAVIVYQDGSEQAIDILPAFHDLLDQVVINFNAEGRALPTRLGEVRGRWRAVSDGAEAGFSVWRVRQSRHARYGVRDFRSAGTYRRNRPGGAP
jgi:hypothetical protein